MYFAPEIPTGSDTVVSARFFTDVWQKENAGSGSSDKFATKEEIMMVLADLNNILIRYFIKLVLVIYCVNVFYVGILNIIINILFV